MRINRDISQGLMIANLIATVLIIAIHYGSKAYIQYTDIRRWNYIFQEFFLNGIARIAVPFFVLISGFFLAQKIKSNHKYTDILLNKAQTLLLPYLIASLMIFLVSTLIKWVTQHDSYQPITLGYFIKGVILQPISSQFWFLRDLIILTTLSPFLLAAKTTYIIPIAFLVGALWVIDYQPFPVLEGWYLLNIETLFFFILGGLLSERKVLLEFIINTSIKNKVVVLFLWLVIVGYRVHIDPRLDVWYVKEYTPISITLYKIAIVLGIVSLLQFSIYLSSNKLLIYLSGLAFFAYLFHFVPLSYFRHITNRLVEYEYSFYINFPIALITVFLMAHLIATFLPRIFALLTGGRTPNKALERTK